MFYKLSINNVKKSLRDYTIYFLTLTFGICVFYVFNSIESQRAMLLISETQSKLLLVLEEMIGYVSVFISVILGFLIIYANRYLIKRRKKELGIYMTLGMEKGKVSRLLILETLIIGIFSLIIGLVLGIFISQGLSVVTAKMFEVDMKEFAFIFSKSAFIKSIIYFGIIYLVVIIFNTVTISRLKLIDLIYGYKINESLKTKRLWVSVIIFILSLACLTVAYYLIIDNGLLEINNQFNMSIILGVIGTFLFFLSLSGFLLRLVKSNKRLYFKNLNMFILRQLNSKINTTFVSMTLICLMLFITIVALSTGMALSNALSTRLKETTPFDASFNKIDLHDKGLSSIADKMRKDGISFDKIVKSYTESLYYKTNLTYGDLIKGGIEQSKIGPGLDNIKKEKVMVMSLSDYNKILTLQGASPVTLDKGQYIINSDTDEMFSIYNYYFNNINKIKIGSFELVSNNKKIMQYSLQNSMVKNDVGTIIVQDEVISGFKPSGMLLNVLYKNSGENDETILQKEIETIYGIHKEKPYTLSLTKAIVYDQSKGLSVIMTYLTMYIGIVFLITSAAVLALQQLSEASDNAQRYGLIIKLGCEQKMVNSALFKQILIYFMMPLLLAIVHSAIGIKVANTVVIMFGRVNILKNILLTAFLILLVYGGYFMATFLNAKNIIKPKKL